MHIQTNDLIKTYNGRNVVDGVSIRVEQGQVVGLLGPNGAGKTTTFYMIVGIEKPSSGTIMIDRTDITQQPYRRKRIFSVRSPLKTISWPCLKRQSFPRKNRKKKPRR